MSQGDSQSPAQIPSVCCILTVCLGFFCSSWECRSVYSHMEASEEAHACLPLPNLHSRCALRQGLPLGNVWIREIVLILPNLCAHWCLWAQPLPLLPGTQPASYPFYPQVLLGHPPSYTADVAATAPVSAVSLPPAVLSPPLPDTLLPPAPELLPKLPSSLAPTVAAASQSVPTQTSTLLPPTNPPLPTGPAVAGPSPAVQLMVEVAQEVCALVPCSSRRGAAGAQL